MILRQMPGSIRGMATKARSSRRSRSSRKKRRFGQAARKAARVIYYEGGRGVPWLASVVTRSGREVDSANDLDFRALQNWVVANFGSLPSVFQARRGVGKQSANDSLSTRVIRMRAKSGR